MRADGLGGIRGAGRHEAARAARHRRQGQLIQSDSAERETRGDRHLDLGAGRWQRRSVVRKSSRRAGHGASSRAGFGITMRSKAGRDPASVLKTSRIRRLARFLTTAPPSRRDATMPSRCDSPVSGDAMIVKYRPWALRPPSKTRWNSARRRSRRARGRVCDGMGMTPGGFTRLRTGGGTCLSARRRNGQAFSPFGAPPLEHQAPILCTHPHEEPVGALPVSPIRLIRPLHDDASLPRFLGEWRNPDSSGARRALSIRGRKIRAFVTLENPMLQSVPRHGIGSRPEVFHRCGKKCGKTRRRRSEIPCIWRRILTARPPGPVGTATPEGERSRNRYHDGQ